MAKSNGDTLQGELKKAVTFYRGFDIEGKVQAKLGDIFSGNENDKKELDRVREELGEMETRYEGHRQELAEVEKDLSSEIDKRISENAVTAEKVKSGKISLSDYMKSGRTPETIRHEVEAEVNEKTDHLRSIIQDELLEIRKLTAREKQLLFEIARREYFIWQAVYKVAGENLEEFARETNRSFLEMHDAEVAFKEASELHRQSMGKSILPHSLNGLSVEGVKELLSDPSFANPFLQEKLRDIVVYMEKKAIDKITIFMGPSLASFRWMIQPSGHEFDVAPVIRDPEIATLKAVAAKKAEREAQERREKKLDRPLIGRKVSPETEREAQAAIDRGALGATFGKN